MKLGLMSQWYAPEPGGGAVPTVLASGLAAREHDVRVLTGFPNYPTGKIYPEYRQRWRHLEELPDGPQVRRVPLFPSHDSNPVSRSANYLSFGASAFGAAMTFLADRDAIWVYNSPATVGAAARQLARRRGVPYLLHVMDLWPDSVLDSGMLSKGLPNRVANRVLSGVVARTHDDASAIAVTSPSQRDALMRRGVDSDKLVYIPVWADEDVYFPQSPNRDLLPLAARGADIVLMYAGAMGFVQQLDTAVRAVAATGARVHLVLVGTGVAEPALRALASSLDAPNIHFLGPKPASAMGALASAADVHLVSLADTPLLRMTMPSKLLSILALGRPVVAMCAGDAAALVQAAGAGAALRPDDEQALTSTLTAMANDPAELSGWGAAGRSYYEEQLSRATAIARVEAELARIV